VVAVASERITEAREVVAGLLERAGISEPPVDLEALAALRGVRQIVYKPLKASEYGLLTTGKRGHTITVNNKHYVRARFTIAHEIAHTLIERFQYSDVDVPLASRKPKGADAIESMCDELAGEILFPYEMFQRELEDTPPTIDEVLRLAKLFDGSIMSTAYRVGGVTDEPVQVISWVRHGENALRAGQRSGSAFLTADGAPPYRSLDQHDSVVVCAFLSGDRERATEIPVPLKPWNVYEVEAQRFNGAKNGYVLSVIKPVDPAR